MNQFLCAIYFLPCIICIIWMFIFYFRDKSITQKLMMAMLVLCIFYFTSYAFYISPWTDYKVMTYLDMFNIPVVLVLLAVNLVFVWTHQNKNLIESRKYMWLYAPALILSSVNFLIVYLAGVDNIANFVEALDRYCSYPPGYDDPHLLLYYQFNIHLLNYLLLAFALLVVGVCIRLSWNNGYMMGDVFRFFFTGKESNSTRVICFLNALSICLLMPLVPVGGLGRSYLLNHPVLGCVLTLLLASTIFCLCYVEYMIDLPRFSLSSLANVKSGVPQNTSMPDVDPKVEEELEHAGMIESIPTELIENLEKAFDEEKIYTETELSIQQLATQLKTNRTTLATAITQVYGMNFRQLLASKRIEAAKRFMLENPDAKQDEVAVECGFATAQAFNQKFKEVTGETPRIWMVKQGKGKDAELA